MGKKCFLHLGLHKTASSSAQATFRSSKKVLRDYNIEFPLFKYGLETGNPKTIANHSIPISSIFSDNPRAYHVNIRWGLKDVDQVNLTYLAQLKKAANSGRDLLLSGEDISVLSNTGLDKLTLLLNDMAFEIIPFAMVRTPYSFACSAIQQQIKGGSFFKLLDEEHESTKNQSRNQRLPIRSDIISRLIDHFGKSLRLLNFNKAAEHKYGPVGFMVEEMKICKPEELTYRRVNESMGNKWIRAKNLSNRYFKGESLLVTSDARGLRSTTIFSNDSKFLLTEHEFKKIEHELVSESNAMKKLMGSTFTENEYEFAIPLTAQDWKLIYLETLASR